MKPVHCSGKKITITEQFKKTLRIAYQIILDILIVVVLATLLTVGISLKRRQRKRENAIGERDHKKRDLKQKLMNRV